MSENLQAEIVIIGGGGSGLTAASAALEKGAKSIIILEKRGELGGNAIYPAGLLAVDTHLQRQLGMDAHTDDVFREAMYYTHWKSNGRLIRTLIDKSSDTIRWLEGKGIIFTSIVTHYPNQSPNTYHVASGAEGTGAQIVRVLGKECRDSPAVRILRETPARQILLDKKGSVCGVVAEGKDGQKVRIDAKSVIVCTGGFSGNEELIRKYDPSYTKEAAPPRGIPNQGDGIMMTGEVGGTLDGMVVYEWEEFFPASMFLTIIARRPHTIWVNRRGERFCDEGILVMAEAANAIARQPGKVKYTLFDEKNKRRMLADALTPFEAFFLKNEAKERGSMPFAEQAEKDIQEYAAKGNIKISESWDEIARWMGVKPGVLKATVETYNASCDHGRDEIFAKDRHYLIPLRHPPYYAMRSGIGLTNTHGGVKINQRMEAVDKDDEPIPGLYAAGVETGAKDWDSYNMWHSGHAFGYTVNSGRIAGEEAAKYVAGK